MSNNLRMKDLFYYTVELADALDNVIAENFACLSRKQAALFYGNDDYVACASVNSHDTYTLHLLGKNMIGKYQKMARFFFMPDYDCVYIKFANEIGNIDDNTKVEVSITNDYIDGPEATWHGGNNPSLLEMIRDFLSPWVEAKIAGRRIDREAQRAKAEKPFPDIIEQLDDLHIDMLLRIDEIENVITKYCCNDLVSDKFNDDLSKISASMLVDTNKLKESIDLLATKTKVVPGKISPKLAEKIEQAPEVTMEELEKKESNMKYDLNPGSKEVDAAYDELQKRKNSVMEGIKARHENMCKEIDESLAHINESEEHVEQNKSRINSMLNELKNL